MVATPNRIVELQVTRLEGPCWGSYRGNSLTIARAEGLVLFKSGYAIFDTPEGGKDTSSKLSIRGLPASPSRMKA